MKFHPLKIERERRGWSQSKVAEMLGMVPGIPPSLYATIAVSDQQLSPQAHAALCALAAFPPKPSSFSEEEALVVSQQPAEVLDELWDTGLLETYGTGRYTLHQTVADYARALNSGDSANQEPLNDCAESTHSHKEESKYDTFWPQSLHDVSTGYSRSRLAFGSFSQSSGHFGSIIAIGSLCIIVILVLSLFNSVQSRFLGLPMPAGGTSTLISLAKYMNNKGIGTIPGQADFDGSDFSYPADQLPHPGQITLNGQPYLFPGNAPGVNDNVVALGQTISIPVVSMIAMALLCVVSMIAMTLLCLIVILVLSLFNSTQIRLPMPAGGTATLVPLAKYMNNKGIGTMPGQANFDGSGFSYPADQLPHAGQITLNGQPYLFPENAPGINDNVIALGQTISVPAGHYQQAFLLVAGSWGLVNSIVIVHYADGSTTFGSLSVPDWKMGPSGIVNTSYRYAPAGIGQGSVHLYAMQIGIDPTKIASSLTLPTTVLPDPSQPSLHVFALTLQS